MEADTKKLIVMVGLCRSVHAASHEVDSAIVCD